jgi:hypothetical protein
MDLDRIDLSTVGTTVCAHNNKRILESRPRLDGLVRRRYVCLDCGERWTTFGPDRKPPRQRRERSKPAPRKLTEEQARRALTDRTTSAVALAAEMGVSRQAISQIRCGISWAKAFPELRRRKDWRDCTECRHWHNNECLMGFPDPAEEGTVFADDCDLYEV